MLPLRMKIAAVLLAACLAAPAAGTAAQKRVRLPYDARYIAARADVRASGPRLILSDSPEVVSEPGVLYRGTATGRIRVFFHHVNGGEEPVRIAVGIRNPDPSKALRYRLTGRAVSYGSKDYLYIGKSVQKEYFAGKAKGRKERLNPGASRELICEGGAHVSPGELAAGVLELRVGAPAELWVVACPKDAEEPFSAQASLAARDEQKLRGTFAAADWEYTLRQPVYSGKTPFALELAGPTQGYAEGIDAISGEPALDYGNYGVRYKVNFEVSGDEPVSFLFNPLGGPFAGYGVLEDKGTGALRLLPIPDKTTAFGDTISEAAELARLEAGSYSFTWSPPSSSFLPVRFWWRAVKRREL